MTRGYIDAASIFGVIAALTYDSVDRWPPWTLQSATEVTSLLINDHELQVASTPGSYTGARGLYDHMTRELSLIISDSSPDASVRRSAARMVRSWVRGSTSAAVRLWTDTQNDPSFEDWLSWSITNQWVNHAVSLNGLFDQQFIPELALMLNCARGEIEQIYVRSCDLREVEHWSREQPSSEDFQLVTNAFVISALLRGRYHDHLAEAESLQILHHPFRNLVLPPQKEDSAFMLSNTEGYFTSIILASALGESTVEQRISNWAQNVVKSRAAVRMGAVDLSQKASHSVAEDLAMKAVKQLNLRVHPRRVAKSLDLLLDALVTGTAGCLSFALIVWTGGPLYVSVPIAAAADVAFKGAVKRVTGESPGEKAASLLYGRSGRLHDLANAAPGRIQGRRDKPSK